MKQKVCGYLAPGHSYTMSMIRDDFNGFVLDPFTKCRHCDLPLPDSVLATLILRIEDEDYEETA